MIQPHDIAEVVRALRDRHGCHTAILYGSYARGDAGRTSDLDVAGFAPVETSKRIAGRCASTSPPSMP